MAISPKQAADAVAANAAALAATLKQGEKILADTCDRALEGHLKTHGRAVVGVRLLPNVPNAFPIPTSSIPVLEELYRRYQAAGWMTKIDGDVLTIDPPPAPR